MKSNLLQIIAKGLIGGAFTGYVIGAYFVLFSKKYVFRADDFRHIIFQEEAEFRFTTAVLLAFVTAFALIGPYVAAGSYGPWVRHAIYGIVGSFGFVVVGALIAGLVNQVINGEQPFGRFSSSADLWHGIARYFGIPLALIVGPWIGIGIGKWRYTEKSVPLGPDNDS